MFSILLLKTKNKSIYCLKNILRIIKNLQSFLSSLQHRNKMTISYLFQQWKKQQKFSKFHILMCLRLQVFILCLIEQKLENFIYKYVEQLHVWLEDLKILLKLLKIIQIVNQVILLKTECLLFKKQSVQVLVQMHL